MHVPVCGKAREMIPRNQRSFASSLGEGRLFLFFSKKSSHSIRFNSIPSAKSLQINGFDLRIPKPYPTRIRFRDRFESWVQMITHR
ncbi:hypothetical protein Bca4012_000833 [Brassica carinata]